MPASTLAKRSRSRRVGESAFGVLLLAKVALMAALAVLLLIAGVWTSWSTARQAMFAPASERGTLIVNTCDRAECHGTLTRAGHKPRRVTVTRVVASEGRTLPVALRSEGRDVVVRTGLPGVVHSWVPFAGSLLLASLVVAGGLRMRRTAWTMGLVGAVTMAGAWALIHWG
ncbi:hypothetical protein [Streptomyces sp. NPDC005438]|uniref:hypothetical protein n=1 Tax=Streptomyces sp. NPDC005438 TaxID=3156880 RepID=UPI00339F6B26